MELKNSVRDYTFTCPHCEQPLEGSTELAGATLICPACEREFVAPAPDGAPAAEAKRPVNVRMKQWLADVRVLVQRAPPVYLKMLMEVPESWDLPSDGSLPERALAAVTKAARTRYAHCPVTLTKVGRVEGMKKPREQADYEDESCKVWVMGRES